MILKMAFLCMSFRDRCVGPTRSRINAHSVHSMARNVKEMIVFINFTALWVTQLSITKN